MALGTVYVYILFQDHQGLHNHKKVEYNQPPECYSNVCGDHAYSTFSSAKENSDSDLITHALVVLDTIILEGLLKNLCPYKMI